MKLRALAPAKVNLGLFVGAPREDGRHRLVTVFESLSLADTLEIEVLGEGASDRVICPGVVGENLAARALAGLRERGWDGPPVSLTIEKRIPVAAGMAGGSADAAAALRLAMAVVGPTRPRAEEVDQLAATLGADVPSQLLPGVSVGTGAGEVVERFEALAEHAFVVLPANFALSTRDVYRTADSLRTPRSDAELAAVHLDVVEALALGATIPDALLTNDLQTAAISLCPACTESLFDARAAGADHAIVSGSGPTVVGIWWGAGAESRAAAAAVWLRDRHPDAVVATPVAAEFAAPSLISRPQP